MKIKKIMAFTAAVCLMLGCGVSASGEAGSAKTVNITIDTAKDRKAISPYIYGVNAEIMERNVKPGSVRAGGNRYTAYNWENNASNAGSDWKNMSDNYFQQSVDQSIKDTPGCAAIKLNEVCKQKDAYSLMTLQLAGYVSADMDGEVSKDQAAPSDRWKKTELVKGSDFTTQPDVNDDTVYMDEFVNYLVKTLGNSKSGGINGYSLDNEPGLWKHTHSLIHPKQTSCEEIVDKSVTMAKAVKEIDPGADVFGPALFGYGAFTNFAGAGDWNTISQDNPDYKWFIDYYLDEMKKAEDDCGTRLLDVLDVHFYTEAKGACGERYCNHFNDPDCVYNKLNATRSLWDDTYTEDSWITDTGAEFLPILPALKESIDTYYPGTKIAITEYDFGGPYDVCGAIAEADALGIFAQNEVYCANLFTMDAQYQLAAINLYRNYDGNGSAFGDTLVSCVSDDIETSTAYAAINGDNEDVITLVVTNKAFSDKTTANIDLGSEYKYAHLYGINSMAADIFDMTDSNSAVTISGDKISLEMEPRTVSLLVIAKDKDALTKSAANDSSSSKAEKEKSKVSKLALFAGIGGAAALCLGGAAYGLKKKKRS